MRAPTTLAPAPAPASGEVGLDRLRTRRRRRTRAGLAVLAALGVGLFAVTLMVGNTFYGPADVLRVLAGQDVAGATFAVGTLRLPRAVLAVVVGASFGAAGCAFQTMLRNTLASPDIVGITAGSSAAAVVGIVVFSWSAAVVSAISVVAGLATALVIYVLAARDGVVGARLVLIGIAVAAMLDGVVSAVLVRAAQWDLQVAMRWLSGSLNGATWDQVVPVVLALVVLGPVVLAQGRNLELARMGDDTARALGVDVARMQLIVVVAAVGLLAFATAASGPIAFVAFLAGPIAGQVVGRPAPGVGAAALAGAVLVLAADLLGQQAFGTRYPVGVVTGALGAPYLVHVLVVANRIGASS